MAEKQKKGGPEVPPSAMDQFAHFLDDEELKKEAAKQREREKAQKVEGAEKPESKEQGKTIEQEEQELREKAAEEVRRFESGAEEAEREVNELSETFEGAAERAHIDDPEARRRMGEIRERAQGELGMQRKKSLDEIERLQVDLLDVKKDLPGYKTGGFLRRQPKEVHQFKREQQAWQEEKKTINDAVKAIDKISQDIEDIKYERDKLDNEINEINEREIEPLNPEKRRLESQLKSNRALGKKKEVAKIEIKLKNINADLADAEKRIKDKKKKRDEMTGYIEKKQAELKEQKNARTTSTQEQIRIENRLRVIMGEEPVATWEDMPRKKRGNGQQEQEDQEKKEGKKKEKEKLFLQEIDRLQNTPRLRASSDALRTRIIQINQQYSGDPLSRNTANGRIIQQDIRINTLDGGRFRISLRESDGYYGIHYEISPQGGSSSQGKARKP